jgi:hypothetical protein
MNKFLLRIKLSDGYMTIAQFILAYGILYTIAINSYIALIIDLGLLYMITKSKSLEINKE